ALELVTHQFQHKQLAVIAPAADSGPREARQRVGFRGVRSPVQAVGEIVLVLGRERLLGPPERCNVIVDLLFGRNLEQHDSALAPIANRFGPQAGTALKAGFEILIGEILLFPLHQAEAARIEIGEGAYLQIARIAEWAPELLTLAIEDREAIGIVHCRPKIIEVLAVIWSE